MNYTPKTAFYDHQRTTLEQCAMEKYWGLFLEMGVGKSKIAIDNFALLSEKNLIDTVLVLAPKGVYDNWVQKEIPAHLPDRIKHKIARWQPNLTEKFKEEMRQIVFRKNREAGTLHILVMNIEALSTTKGTATATKYLKDNPKNMMIVDESTTIKNRKSLRSKNVVKVGKEALYKRILTGSPVTKSPLDLYAQCEFLGLSALGFKSFFSYRNRYAVIQQRYMGARSFQEITGYQRLDELNEKLNGFTTRILKSECLDLPDKVYLKREVPLTTEQKSLYVQMKKLALSQLEDGSLATTASVLTQIMRLQQICCGFLQPDDEPIQEIKNNRLNELLSVADEVQGKVIIWSSWTHDIRLIAEALRRRFGNKAAATYYGGTPQDERQDIVKDFQDPDSELRFFVGQPRTGGFGLTLTAATTVIYYSNSYDLEIRLQSEDRAHRISQTKTVTYVDLVSPDTIDEKILKALRAKIDIAGQVLGEDIKQWLI